MVNKSKRESQILDDFDTLGDLVMLNLLPLTN